MIDEDLLSERLRDAVEGIEVPQGGPQRVLAARDQLTRDRLARLAPGGSGTVEGRGRVGHRSVGVLVRRRPVVLAAAAVVAGAVLVAAVGIGIGIGGRSNSKVAGPANGPGSPTSGQVAHPAVAPAASPASTAATKGLGVGAGSGSASGSAAQTPLAGASGATPAASPPAGVPRSAAPLSGPLATAPLAAGPLSKGVPALEPQAAGPPTAPQPTGAPGLPSKVIKTGSVSVVVPRGRLNGTVDQLSSLAAGLGGYVQSSQASENVLSPTSQATLRVPVGQFEQLLGEVEALGRPVSVTTAGQDVTSQYVDLAAQLQALESSRTQYLQILAKAQSIGDILAVEQQITPLETQIEQLQGQQKVMDDQTSYGTLSVTVSDAPRPVPHPPVPHPQSGWARAWTHAGHSFVTGAQSVISFSGGLGVFMLCALALVVLGRLGWRVLRRRLV